MKNRLLTWFSFSALILVTINGFAKEPEWIAKAYHQSLQYEYLQKYDKAIDVLSPIYKKYPKGYLVNLRLGWLYYNSNRYANSISHYSNANHILPGALEPKLGLALDYLTQQKYDNVIATTHQILQKDYYNYYANLYLIRALSAQKHYQDVVTVTHKILGLYPLDNKFLNELGLAYLAQKKYEKANKCFNTVLLTDPVNVIAKSSINKIESNSSKRKQ